MEEARLRATQEEACLAMVARAEQRAVRAREADAQRLLCGSDGASVCAAQQWAVMGVQDPLWQLVVFVGLAPSNRGVSGSGGNYLSGRWRLLQLHDELFISFPSLDPSDR